MKKLVLTLMIFSLSTAIASTELDCKVSNTHSMLIEEFTHIVGDKEVSTKRFVDNLSYEVITVPSKEPQYQYIHLYIRDARDRSATAFATSKDNSIKTSYVADVNSNEIYTFECQTNHK